jgi:6-hydroxynicotinate reductase
MRVHEEKCIGCGFCVRDCPLEAVRLVKKKAEIQQNCTDCGACIRVCEQGALTRWESPPPGAVQCDACPIGCWVREGYPGACRRYRNAEGRLERITPLQSYQEVADVVGPDPIESIRRPLVTGIGAGTTYPDCKPAPVIVKGKRNDLDVVTVVTEAPLSYSGIVVKIDTDLPVGEEGAPVMAGKRKVGMVVTEQYGSKMLSIGGVNLLTGKDGLVVARTVSDIANKRAVKLKVEGGARLELQVGQAPVIDGQTPASMRVGCGSATLGLFAPLFKEAADEVIVLDSHLTSLMSEHTAGRFVKAKPSGVRLKFRQSTPGRYFGDHGGGWGGTSIMEPLEVIETVDRKIAWTGMRILITETTGQQATLLEFTQEGNFRPIQMTKEGRRVLDAISSSCEPSLVSALYTGGAGGSARAGVALYPVRLTRAVHAGKANLTVGGAPVFLLPGGGINFMVDVARVKADSFYWTPTPATICPIEYTMELSEYKKMGGHLGAMAPFPAREPRSVTDR